jgi:hypothetical protein
VVKKCDDVLKCFFLNTSTNDESCLLPGQIMDNLILEFPDIAFTEILLSHRYKQIFLLSFPTSEIQLGYNQDCKYKGANCKKCEKEFAVTD